MSRSRAWDEVARVAASGVREGTLKLRDVVGLGDDELRALATAAAALQRSGRHADARAVYSLLLLHDPTSSGAWRAMADLHHGVGDHAVAVACYETAALLGGRDEVATRREARSLEQLGHPSLAAELGALSPRRSERGAS